MGIQIKSFRLGTSKIRKPIRRNIQNLGSLGKSLLSPNQPRPQSNLGKWRNPPDRFQLDIVPKYGFRRYLIDMEDLGRSMGDSLPID